MLPGSCARASASFDRFVASDNLFHGQHCRRSSPASSCQNWTTATSLSLIFCDISHSFSWHSASHSPSAIAELLVLLCDCSCQPEIMQLIKELSLLVYPQYTSGSKLLQLGSSSTSKVSRYTSEIPSLPLFALMDLYLFIRKVCRYILLL